MELVSVAKMRNRIVRWKSLVLDIDQHCLHIGDSAVPASRAEIGLLHLLLSRRNLPMSKEIIMTSLFGEEHGRDLRQADVFVARLRRSLTMFGLAGVIQTIDGRGYAVMDDHGDALSAADAQPHGWLAALAC